MINHERKYVVAAMALELAVGVAKTRVDALERTDPYELPMSRLAAIRSAHAAIRHAPYIGRDGDGNISHMVCVMASEACTAASLAVSRLSGDHPGKDADTNPLIWLMEVFRIHRIDHDDLFAARTREEENEVIMCEAPQWYRSAKWGGDR